MSEDSFETDAFDMLQISDNVSDNTRLDGTHHVSSSRPDIWSADSHEFRGVVRNGLQGSSSVDSEVLACLWERFGETALGKVEGMEDAARMRMKDKMQEIAKGRYEAMQAKVQELLDEGPQL
jgi:hypothetical protein